MTYANDHVRSTPDRPFPSTRWVSGLALAALLLAGAFGCEDGAAADRNRVQAQIDSAARELSLVRLSGSMQPETRDDGRPESREAARTTLQDIVRRTSGINQGTTGQQEAAALLAASASFELGALAAEDLFLLESQLMAERGSLHTTADAALRLAALAQGMALADHAVEQAHLTRSREQVENERRTHETEQRRLQAPIDERQRSIERDRTESGRFIEEAGALRREALLVSPAAGLDTWTEAIELERRAARIERQIADLEVELDYQYRPEFAFVSQLADARRDQIRVIDGAMDALRDARRSRQENVAATSDVIRTLSQRMDGMIRTLTAATGTADEQLDAVADHFDRAAQQAQRAARGSARDAAGARMIALRAVIGTAQAHADRAAAAAAHAALLQRVADAGGTLGDAARAAQGVREMNERARALRDQAKSHFERAREIAGQLPATPEVESIGRRIDGGIAHLEGREVAPEPVRRPAMSRSSADTGRSSGSGADSPEALIALLNSAGEDAAALGGMEEIFHAEGAIARRLLDLQTRSGAVMAELIETMTERFGEASLMDAFGEMAGAASPAAGLTDLRLTSQSEDRATASANNPMTGPMEITLVRTPSGWKIDFMSLLGPVGSDPQMIGMMEQGVRAMMRAFESVHTRLREGEFASADEVSQAIEAAMMSAMMGG